MDGLGSAGADGKKRLAAAARLTEDGRQWRAAVGRLDGKEIMLEKPFFFFLESGPRVCAPGTK